MEWVWLATLVAGGFAGLAPPALFAGYLILGGWVGILVGCCGED